MSFLPLTTFTHSLSLYSSTLPVCQSLWGTMQEYCSGPVQAVSYYSHKTYKEGVSIHIGSDFHTGYSLQLLSS